MKPNASTKSWNSSSRWSLPPAIVQPSGTETDIAPRLLLRVDDRNRGAHRRERLHLQDVVVEHAHAAVADVAGNQIRVIGAVDGDLADAAIEALQHIAERGDAELEGAVGTAGV